MSQIARTNLIEALRRVGIDCVDQYGHKILPGEENRLIEPKVDSLSNDELKIIKKPPYLLETGEALRCWVTMYVLQRDSDDSMYFPRIHTVLLRLRSAVDWAIVHDRPDLADAIDSGRRAIEYAFDIWGGIAFAFKVQEQPIEYLELLAHQRLWDEALDYADWLEQLHERQGGKRVVFHKPSEPILHPTRLVTMGYAARVWFQCDVRTLKKWVRDRDNPLPAEQIGPRKWIFDLDQIINPAAIDDADPEK